MTTTVATLDKYPTIKRLVIELACDNGIINVQEPESIVIDKVTAILESDVWKSDLNTLYWIESDLSLLCVEDQGIFIGGDDEDQQNLHVCSEAHILFNQIFESISEY